MVTVLVLTNSYDDCHVEAVFDHIHRQGGQTVRLDVDRVLRGESHLSFDYSTGKILHTSHKKVYDLCSVDSVWYRKPFGFSQTYGFLEHIQDPVQRAIVDKETHDTVDSICMLLSNRFWINHPTAISKARLKPYQYAVAKQLGLPVLPTLVTSDPAAARSFCLEAPSVFKPITVSNMEYGDEYYMVETTLITDALIGSLDLIRSQPIILQRFIEKKNELRVTCIGDELFIAKQTPDDTSTQTVDWRSLQDNGSRYDTDFALPDDIVIGIRKLMSKFDLGFAAMDFVVDSQENIYFLEVNPNGQWLGYTDEIGLPATASMAKCLVNRTRHLHPERR